MGSLNHSMVEVGRAQWRSSGPTPLLQHGHLQLVAQDYVQMAFKYLQDWQLHNLSGQPVSCLTVKNCFLMFRGNLLCLILCPLPPVMSLGTPEKSLAPSFFAPSLHIFPYIDKNPLKPSDIQAEQSQV